MKACVLEKYGSVAKLREMPMPDVRDNDVLVEVHAASLNPLDSKIRDGAFKQLLPVRHQHL